MIPNRLPLLIGPTAAVFARYAIRIPNPPVAVSDLGPAAIDEQLDASDET